MVDAKNTSASNRERKFTLAGFVSSLIIYLGGIGSAAGGLLAVIGFMHPNASVPAQLLAWMDAVQGRLEAAAKTISPQLPACVSAPGAPTANASAAALVPVAPVAIQSFVSGGVRASVTAVELRQDQIYVNLYLQNMASSRFYFTDARTDSGQVLVLSSGGHVESPFTGGMPFCNGDVPSCLSNPNETDLNKLDYLEPGASSMVSLRYSYSGQTLPFSVTTSFSLVLIGRFSAPNQSGGDVSSAQQFRFSFGGIPIITK